MSTSMEITHHHFRETLANYPTGVTVVTSCGDLEEPVGMVVGTFTSASLEPPLVAFLPDKRSASWKKLSKLNNYCFNILGAHQVEICRILSSKEANKFSYIQWTLNKFGAPAISGSIVQIDCIKESEYEAGDHLIVLARVIEMNIGEQEMPLLFHRGRFGTFTP